MSISSCLHASASACGSSLQNYERGFLYLRPETLRKLGFGQIDLQRYFDSRLQSGKFYYELPQADDDWVTLNVEMYDRSIAGFNVEDCWQLHYIQENFGDPNHIKVNWIPVSRWEEGTILSTRLAGGTAPDICMTYGTDLVQQYIDMGGIMPLDDLLAEYGQELTAFLGDEVLQYGQYDVGDGKEQYYLPARRIVVATQSMFIRKDWLDKLISPSPR